VSTLDLPILLFIGFIVVVLVWGAGRARLSRPQAAFILVAILVGVGVGGGVALLNRLPGESVALLNNDAADPMNGQCYLSFIEGELVTDPVTGTAIIGRNGGSTDVRFPVMWPAGWTGQRTAFSDVEVLDPTGKVVVRTGTRVHLMGGSYNRYPDAWLACSEAYPLP
jgi:hypothetical protein